MNETASNSPHAGQLEEQDNSQLSLPSQHHLVVWLNNLSIQETNDSNAILPGEDGEGLIHLRNCSDRIKIILSLIKVPELGNMLSPPLKRKLLFLSRCDLKDCDERLKAMRTAISIGNRIIVEFIVKYTDPHQIISNLWNAVRNRGCQFLGPAIQEEILKLVLLALEDGNELTRKVLIMFVMQRLLPHFPYQASKTSIGHVIQILYRASCFEVIKREGDSSLMQLKPEFRNYEALRREHDTQIISISMEAGLRISPEQWSSLLYGDNRHKSHMQSIIDKLQTIKLSSDKLINKLKSILSKTDDPGKILDVMTYFEQLAYFEAHLLIDPIETVCSLEHISVAIDAVNFIIIKFISFLRFIYQRPMVPDATNNQLPPTVAN